MKVSRLNQSQLDVIQSRMMLDPSIVSYITTQRYLGRWLVDESDWSGIAFGIDDESFIHIDFDRTRDLEMSIALYSTKAIHAGKLIVLLKELINRYKPRAINTSVHSSNVKSLKLNRKIFGDEYAIKESYAWNMLIGEYEDLHLFRKIMSYEKTDI